MLDIALQFLRDELNTYIRARTGSDTVEVKMSRIVDETGKYAFTEETLGMALINIEEERTMKAHLPEYAYRNGQHVVMEPELKLNLHILCAANLKQYDVALKYISYILTYFQSHPSFTPEQYPALDVRIGKLIVELQSLGFEQLNQIWAFIGGKHLPSVIYRVRLIVLQDEVRSFVQPPLTVINADIRSR